EYSSSLLAIEWSDTETFDLPTTNQRQIRGVLVTLGRAIDMQRCEAGITRRVGVAKIDFAEKFEPRTPENQGIKRDETKLRFRCGLHNRAFGGHDAQREEGQEQEPIDHAKGS
ncbi:MAG: hypothetical protein RL333_379, partial [Pseudomonadota bacterium]